MKRISSLFLLVAVLSLVVGCGKDAKPAAAPSRGGGGDHSSGGAGGPVSLAQSLRCQALIDFLDDPARCSLR